MQKLVGKFLNTLIIGAAVCTLASCSDDGASGEGGNDNNGAQGSNVSTGLPETKSLGDLTAEEAVQGCETLFSQAAEVFNQETVLNFYCTTLSLQFAQDAAGCNSSVEECLMQPDTADSAAALGLDFSNSDCETSAEDLADCTATVGELEQCFNDMLAPLADAIAVFSCDLAGDMEALQAASAGLEGGGAPASCTALETTCPSVIGAE